MKRDNSAYPIPGSHDRIERDARLPMWIIPVFSVLMIALLAILYVWRPNASTNYVPEYAGGARAQLSQTLFDYGEVKNNSQVQTSFSIKNIGDRQLQLSQEPLVEVVEGCCPPRATIDKMELDPGEEATVSFAFSMHEGMDGPHDFRVRMRTNDTEEPEQEVTVLSNWVD
jgi:hypothetical protein